MNDPKWIIVHHSGGTNENPLQDSSNYTVQQCNYDHKIRFNFISTLGYYVGYQYFIDKHGIITQCRSDKEEGAHTIGKNRESLGICLAGNFDVTKPTEAQIETLKKIIEKKMKEYLIPIENVVPHRIFAVKTCYGKLLGDKWCQEIVTPKVEQVIVPVVELPKELPIITQPICTTSLPKKNFVQSLILSLQRFLQFLLQP